MKTKILALACAAGLTLAGGCVAARYQFQYADGTKVTVGLVSLAKEPKFADAKLAVGTNVVASIGTYESKQDQVMSLLKDVVGIAEKYVTK